MGRFSPEPLAAIYRLNHVILTYGKGELAFAEFDQQRIFGALALP